MPGKIIILLQAGQKTLPAKCKVKSPCTVQGNFALHGVGLAWLTLISLVSHVAAH